MDPREREALIIGSGSMFGGTILSNIFNFLRTFIIARVLGPALFGNWNILMVIFTYGNYSHLGFLDGMNKYIPLLRGKADLKNAEHIKDVTFWIVVLATATFCLVLVILALTVKQVATVMPFNLGLLILVAVIVLAQLFAMLTSLLRIDKKFSLMAASPFLLSLFFLLAVLLLFRFYDNKLYGALLSMALSYLLVNLYIMYKGRYAFRPIWDFSAVKNIFWIGLPVIIIQITYGFFVSIDRWMIIGFIDQLHVGYYGLGITMSNFLFGAFSMVAFTTYPTMLEMFGRTGDHGASQKLIEQSSLALGYVLAVICPLCCFCIPFLVAYFLPAYLPGIFSAVVLSLGAYFLSLTTIFGNYLVSVNKQWDVLKIQAVTIILCLALDFLFIKFGWGINGVAVATVLAYFFYSLFITSKVMRYFSFSLKEIVLKVNALYQPFFISLIILAPLMFFLKLSFLNFWHDISIVFAQGLIFTVLLIAILWKTEQGKKVFRTLHNLTVSKLMKKERI